MDAEHKDPPEDVTKGVESVLRVEEAIQPTQLERSWDTKCLSWLRVHRNLGQRVSSGSETPRTGLKIKLGEFIERKEVQYFLTGLVVFDIIVLSLELLLESVVENAEGVDHHALHVAEEALFWTTVGILSVFALELILLLFSFGLQFFRHPLYVIDLLVIATAFLIEIIFKVELASVLTLVRLWRVLRIAHGVVLAEEEAHRKTKMELETKTLEAEELKRKLSASLAEVEKLRHQLKNLQKSGELYAASLSHSHHANVHLLQSLKHGGHGSHGSHSSHGTHSSHASHGIHSSHGNHARASGHHNLRVSGAHHASGHHSNLHQSGHHSGNHSDPLRHSHHGHHVQHFHHRSSLSTSNGHHGNRSNHNRLQASGELSNSDSSRRRSDHHPHQIQDDHHLPGSGVLFHHSSSRNLQRNHHETTTSAEPIDHRPDVVSITPIKLQEIEQDDDASSYGSYVFDD